MGFAGEIATIGLTEIFRNVAFNRLTGVLTIREPGRSPSIWLKDGAIRAFSPGKGRTLDYALIAERARAATPEAIEAARARPARRTLKTALLPHESFNEGVFNAAVAAAVEEEILLLFGLREASFVFEEEPPPRGMFDAEQLGCAIELDPDAIAMEAARRHDEWHDIAQQVGSDSEIYLACDGGAEESLAPEVSALLQLLDGTRDLRSVTEQLPIGRFRVMRLVAQLAEQGRIVRASGEQLRAIAQHARDQGEVNRAAHHLLRALEGNRDSEEIHRELVALYEGAGRKSDAAAVHRRLARLQEERGDVAGAIASHEAACLLTPYDTDALRSIAALHETRGDGPGHRKAILRLGAALNEQGRSEEARAAFEGLLVRGGPEFDGELHEALAATYVKLHEPKNASRELIALGEWAAGRKDVERALHFFRSALAVDRDCEVAAVRLAEIEEGAVRRRRGRRRRRGLALALFFVASLAAIQFVREAAAQEALHRATMVSVGGLARADRGDAVLDALTLYARICEDFPLTHCAGQAHDMVRALLLTELERVRGLLASDPHEAERVLSLLVRIRFPEELADLWAYARDDLLGRLTDARAVSAGAR